MPVSSDSGRRSTGRSAASQDVNVDCMWQTYSAYMYDECGSSLGNGEGGGGRGLEPN